VTPFIRLLINDLSAGTAFFLVLTGMHLMYQEPTCHYSKVANQNNYFVTCVVPQNAAVITVSCLLETVGQVNRLHQMNITGDTSIVLPFIF
jgi:hypothetical protein